MLKLLNSPLTRLRVTGVLEGISLIVLTGIAVPVKYINDDPSLVKIIGPLHGLLFLLYVINAISVGVEYRWKFSVTTWKVLLACIIPFGTFYIDRKILRRL